MVDDVINSYINRTDWRTAENANGGRSISGMKSHVVGDILAKHLLSNLSERAGSAHTTGRMHIHDLRGGLYASYCCGADLKEILMRGLGITNSTKSLPAKHLDVAVDHIGNFIQIMSNEHEGAIALSSFDTLLAPFVKEDNLTQRQVTQQMQRLVFGLNYESRQSYQSPFSNLSLDWVVPKDLKDVPCIVGGKIMSYSYSELQHYMDMINIGLLTVLSDGDADGKPLTFPIPSYAVRDESMFIDTDEKTKLLWELTAKTGAPYFSNYLGSGIDPYTIRSLCCRLSLNLKEIADATGGIWDYGAKTGSLSVVTLNANRAALEANGHYDSYFANLIEYADIATDVLLLRKDHILEAFENGLMPYTKEYIGKLDSFFLTHGVVGVFDAYMNMDTECDYYQFADDTLKTLKGYSKCLSTTTDWKLWNIEQTPMEGGAYRLAKSDRQYYPDCYVGGDSDDIYLTNSTHLPVDNNLNIIDEINIRSNLDRMYTGGTLFNYYANESASPESVKELIHKLCLNTKLPYIAYTPTFGICAEHGITYGSDRCSVCGEPIEVYTRVVGYIRPASKFNIGQLQQFKNRKYHNANQE